MSNWFDEKTPQVDISSITAFGILLTSRHAKANELSQMLAFVSVAAKDGVEHHLKEVFYDSNSCCCSFKFKGNLRLGDIAEKKLLAAAKATIGQFEWFGSVYNDFDPSEL